DPARAARFFLGGLALAAGAAILFSPQLFLWHWYFGSIRTPQPPQHMRWEDPAIVPTIFSLRGGLLPWSPILYLVVPGLALARRPLGGLAWRLGLVLCAEIWVN